ncbi:hypothetical protein ACO0SA_000071 [Hanseniaspora valbyensis]
MGKKKNNNSKKQQKKNNEEIVNQEEEDHSDVQVNSEEETIENKSLNSLNEEESLKEKKEEDYEKLDEQEEKEKQREKDAEEDEIEEELEEKEKQVAKQEAEDEDNDEEEEEEEEENLTKDELIERLTEERDSIQEQYDDLLDKISGMKSLFQTMKQSEKELATVKDQLEEYSSQNLLLRDKVNNFRTESETLNAKLKSNDSTIKQLTEKNKFLEQQLSITKDDFNKNKDFNEREMEAMKIIRKDLNERVENLKLLLNNNNKDIELYKKEINELKNSITEHEETEKFLNSKIEALEAEKTRLTNENIANISEAEKKQIELQSRFDLLIEEKQEQSRLIDSMSNEKLTHQETETELINLKEQLKTKFEEISELKSENIKISQHLQNSLLLLKKATSTEQIDKELISNLIVTFVSIPRGESRKYEVLELMASFLDWDDLRKKEAGLMYNRDNLNNQKKKREIGISENSIVGKWTEFLEQESEK